MLQTAFLKNKLWVLVLCLTSCRQHQQVSALPYYNTPEFTPLFLSSSEASKKITHVVAPFSFSDEEGKIVTEKNVSGKIHVADFMFTSCGSICPVMTERMNDVAKAYEKDTAVVILSYSVTPWIDTPDKLKKYKQARGISKHDWHFLTGNKAAIYSLARTSYFAEENLGFTKDSSEFLHTEHFILVDASKRIRGIYNGTLLLEVQQLIKDIAALKQEAVQE